MVGYWKRIWIGKLILNFSQRREIIWDAKMDCPPNSKKLSLIPGLIDKTWDQISAKLASYSFRGAIKGLSNSGRVKEGAGKAPRSILPLALRGNFAKNT